MVTNNILSAVSTKLHGYTASKATRFNSQKSKNILRRRFCVKNPKAMTRPYDENVSKTKHFRNICKVAACPCQRETAECSRNCEFRRLIAAAPDPLEIIIQSYTKMVHTQNKKNAKQRVCFTKFRVPRVQNEEKERCEHKCVLVGVK